MTKISVIVVTARMGCLDVLVNGMLAQTMSQDEFEVIVVDSCYRERHKFFDRATFPGNFFHVELPRKYDYYDACWANNFGLTIACGELIVFFSDLNWPDENFLKDHWLIYKTIPGYSMTGYLDRYPVPRLKPNLTWDNAWWSIFERELTYTRAVDYFREMPVEYSERKNGGGSFVPNTPYFELPGDFFYGALNESIPMAVLKELNGWDESYDGGYGSADIDLGARANLIGWKFLIKPDSINKKFGTKSTSAHVPGVFNKITKSPEENYAHYQRQMMAIRGGERSAKALIGAW